MQNYSWAFDVQRTHGVFFPSLTIFPHCVCVSVFFPWVCHAYPKLKTLSVRTMYHHQLTPPALLILSVLISSSYFLSAALHIATTTNHEQIDDCKCMQQLEGVVHAYGIR